MSKTHETTQELELLFVLPSGENEKFVEIHNGAGNIVGYVEPGRRQQDLVRLFLASPELANATQALRDRLAEYDGGDGDEVNARLIKQADEALAIVNNK